MSETATERKKRPGRKPRPVADAVADPEAAKERYYAPKAENMLFARRLKAACEQKGWGRADLARALVARGVLREDPQNPGEPVSRSRAFYWFSAIVRPNRKILAVICDLLEKPMSYFSDPDYTDDLSERAIQLTTELILRVTRSGGDLVTEAEGLLGTPHLMDTRRRRLFSETQADLIRGLKALAPRPWEQLSETEQRQFLEALLREMKGAPP